MKAPESSLPIISIAPYLPSDLIAPPGETSTPSREPVTREQVARAVHLACRDVGFFYLDVGSFIRLDEMREVLDLGRDFFSLPGEDKEEIGLAKSDGIRGYQKLNQNVTQGKADHHEGIDFYASNPYKSLANSSTRPEDRPGLRPLEGENQWPTQMPHMKPRMEQWVDKMKILGLAVMEAMADGLGCTPAEKEDWRGMIDDSFWVMRMIGYPPLPDGADGISCGEHKDYGCLTFLLADPIPGSLQVLSTDGQWLNADMIPNCLVVNIGEMIQRWTGGLYPATLHRVIHRSPKYRVSVPFFFEPNFSARVRTLPAAERRMAEEGFSPKPNEEVVYGDFLLGKVSGNFKY